MAYSPALYMHDLDRKAFDALNAFPHFVRLQEAYIANVDERAAKIQFLANGIRLSDNQMPETYGVLPPICEKLGIDIPDLYMVKSRNKRDLNAFTGGITTPFICVTSELVKQLTPQMMASAIAHECGHIACKHYLYHSLAQNLANGVEVSPLSKIPAIRKHLSNALVTALLFWDRCSELSADRAAVLCDGDAGRTIDTLLKVHGFDQDINRDEFIKQALDLKGFVNDSKSNKLMEQMIVQWDSHPLLATRAYECYDWAQTSRFRGILDGTLSAEAGSAGSDVLEEDEVLAAEVTASVEGASSAIEDAPPEIAEVLDRRLKQLDDEIERYTVDTNGLFYAYAVACGIMAGWLDSEFFADGALVGHDLGLSYKQVNTFIQNYAEARGLGRDRLKDAIAELEKAFPVAQDNVWKGVVAKVTPKNHHLADLAHHPTPLGLAAALAVQFLRIGTFVNRDGEWRFVFVETAKENVIAIVVPAVITGILNWLVAISEEKYEAAAGKEIPTAISKLAHVIASTPMILEIAKCADNWFGHLVSDMGGSKNTAGGGMGIPGVFLSLFYELASLPGVRGTGLAAVLDDLYENHKLDLRHELAHAEHVEGMAWSVMLNELFVRIGCMFLHLEKELLEKGGIKDVNWRYVFPFANRTIDRMLLVSTMTFNVFDTADAAIRAAIESGGNWVVFSGRFVARYNYVGAGRAALAIVREVSNERREAQLIHERMILMEAKASMMYDQLQDFKARLNEKLTSYLVEDIESFLEGFDDINEGLKKNDSNLVIRGNVTIQRMLGKEPQFTSQQEFDDLMESDIALVL